MDDAHIKRLRRTVAATPTDEVAQAALNAALRRVEVVRTCIRGTWYEAPIVLDRRGRVVTGHVSDPLLVTLRDAPFFERITELHWRQMDMYIAGEHFLIESDVGDRLIETIRFGDYTSANDMIRWFDANGLRPATLKELLAYAAQRPQIPWNFWLTALGSSTFAGRDKLVPKFTREDGVLTIGARDWSRHWRDYNLFAAVRIDSPSAASQDVVADLPGTSC